MPKRRICAVLVDRANYGRLKPVLEVLRDHPDVEFSLICGGTMVLERFGNATKVLQEDGFTIYGRVYMELEGSTPATMAKSVGMGIIEFSNELARIQPEMVLMIGDRYEALAVAISAAYMNLTLVHVQGGEVSGSIDESARHAITKFAHYHLPSTRRAADYLVQMGEKPESILGIGCPSSDLAKQFEFALNDDEINRFGSGASINTTQPYALSVFHPTTTEFGGEAAQMQAVLEGLQSSGLPTVLLWPNIDAGSDHISKAIRRFREQHNTENWLRIVTNFEPETYLKVLAGASLAVGNSSSFVRDASYFGTPVVLVGNRQAGRERGEHVTHVPPTTDAVCAAIQQQLQHGRYSASDLYGDGNVSAPFVEALLKAPLYSQKQLSYVTEKEPLAA